MDVTGVSVKELETIARKLGVKLYNVRETGQRVKHVLFVIRPKYQSDKFRAVNKHMGGHRRVWAVCWHGHREFLTRLFEVNPNARVKTVLADYKGVEDFERKFKDTGYKNAGSQVYPVYVMEQCDCKEAA
jgi:hypothetical protein